MFATQSNSRTCRYVRGDAEYGQLLGEFFRLQQKLYQAGARNFLFIDVCSFPLEMHDVVTDDLAGTSN